MSAEPAPPVAGWDSPPDAVVVREWPSIPPEDREIAQVIAAEVSQMRGTDPPSVAHEERLREDVETVVRRAVAAPQASGLPLPVVSGLAGDPQYRRMTVVNAMMLASHLWPLSLLVYGADLENIVCLGHDHWMVSTVGRKAVLSGHSPFPADDDVIEYFRRVLRLRGVTGDQTITDAMPIAEANVGSVIRLVVAKRPAVSGLANVKASIRIPARMKVRDLSDYVQQQVMPAPMAVFVDALVRARANILIAGGTGTGKTT